MTKQEKDQWIVDQYNRNRLPEDHITSAQEIKSLPQFSYYWLGELVEAYPNNMELGAKVRAKYLSEKGYKPVPEHAPDPEQGYDTWFDKNDRKQRG